MLDEENINNNGEFELEIQWANWSVATVFTPDPDNPGCADNAVALFERVYAKREYWLMLAYFKLKEMIISTVFQKANPESGKEFTEQSSFVMDGLGKARIVKRSETIAATGDIQLGRLAAKFTVRISVDDTFTDTNGKKYTPVVDKMQVHLVNASNTTQLTGALGTRNFD